jgi:hypothetical protein
MPPLVTAGTPGRRVIVRQRSVESPPYTNCRLVDGARHLVFGGVNIPDRRRLIRAWRDATGVPEVGPSGAQGTTGADMLRGAALIIPWVPFEYGAWDEDALLAAIEGGRLTFTAGVKYDALPDRLRRWSPTFTRNHAAGVVDMRRRSGSREVWWVDGLRTDDAEGEWVRWPIIRDAIEAAGMVTRSGVWGMTLEKGAAMSTAIIPDRAYGPPATVTVPKGTPTWAWDPRAMTLVPQKDTRVASTGTTIATVRVSNRPDRPGVPETRMVLLASGPRAGEYVRARDVTITEAPAPGDCQPLIDAAVSAATAPLIERLAAWESARTAHDAVTFPDPVL